MNDHKYQWWTAEYDAWVQRVRDTHDAVRFTVAHRVKNWERAEDVAVQVVIAMLGRPRVFRYQGLPYAGRIGATAESILAGGVDDYLDVPDWSVLTRKLEGMPDSLRPILVAAFVHGHTDDEIAYAAGVSTDTVIAQRTEVEQYLKNIAGQPTTAASGGSIPSGAAHTS